MLHRTMLREMGQIQREFDELFGHFGFAGPLRQVAESHAQQEGAIQVNLSEDAENLYLEALLPGVEPEQLAIEILGDTLNLSGERLVTAGEEKLGVLCRRERAAWKMQRSVDLPLQVEAEKVTAEYRQGLLRITLPKAPVAVPKKIEIKVV